MAVKKFSCPVCGSHLPFSYAVTISDGKRHVCAKCGSHLIPQTKNVIYRRVLTVGITMLFALLYSGFVFDKMEVARTFVNQLVMLAAVVFVFLASVYLLVVRGVVMRPIDS